MPSISSGQAAPPNARFYETRSARRVPTGMQSGPSGPHAEPGGGARDSQEPAARAPGPGPIARTVSSYSYFPLWNWESSSSTLPSGAIDGAEKAAPLLSV